jgi:hypothetical protein
MFSSDVFGQEFDLKTVSEESLNLRSQLIKVIGQYFLGFSPDGLFDNFSSLLWCRTKFKGFYQSTLDQIKRQN